MKIKNNIFYLIIFQLGLVLLIISNLINPHTVYSSKKNDLFYIIPFEKEVERGLSAFLKRTTTEAIENHADYIIFEIDTPGGRVDSAGEIGTIIQNVPTPTV